MRCALKKMGLCVHLFRRRRKRLIIQAYRTDVMHVRDSAMICKNFIRQTAVRNLLKAAPETLNGNPLSTSALQYFFDCDPVVRGIPPGYNIQGTSKATSGLFWGRECLRVSRWPQYMRHRRKKRLLA